MGKMNIAVDARGGDKKCAFNFNWEGDDAAIRSIISGIEKSAALAGVTTRQLTQSYLKHLPAMGLRKNKNEQRIQMVAILYIILNLSIEGRPGLVRDYAAAEDIHAKLFIADGDFRAEFGGE